MAADPQAPVQGRSLRRDLLAWLLLPLVVLVPLAAALLYLMAVRPAMDSLDRALSDTTIALAGILDWRDGRAVLPLTEQTARALRADAVDEVVFAVADPQGRLLDGESELLALRPELAPGEWHYFYGRVHATDMRIVAHAAPCGQQVCPILVAESLGKRADAERAVALAALVVSAMLAACLALLALLAVSRGLRPLSRVSRDVERRSLQRLEPLTLDALPREVASFGAAINDLFMRLRQSVTAQRAFLDDASHQLRTPLAVLLSESEQALQQPHSPELHARLSRLHAAAERSAHLSQQLLTLARTEGAAQERRATERVDLARLMADAADEWIHPALAAGQDLGFELQPAPVRGEPVLLREMAGNLVHNAQQHAGRGAHVTVRTRCEGAQVVLEVEDDGPGLAGPDRERVWDRFYRAREARGPGTGLVLAIVQDVARLHGGRTELSQGAQGRGLVVRITLPRDDGQTVTKL